MDGFEALPLRAIAAAGPSLMVVPMSKESSAENQPSGSIHDASTRVVISTRRRGSRYVIAKTEATGVDAGEVASAEHRRKLKARDDAIRAKPQRYRKNKPEKG